MTTKEKQGFGLYFLLAFGLAWLCQVGGPIFFAASHKNRPDGSALPGFDDYLHPARLYLQWGNPQRCNM